ncbi:heavy metal-associated domain-containing protein [Acinetobacter baumannii]
MSCQGCSGAVKRVLEKTEGVESFDIDLEKQKVTVKGNLSTEEVLQAVSKSGKKTSLWEEAEAPAPELVSKPTEVTVAAESTETIAAKPAEPVVTEAAEPVAAEATEAVAGKPTEAVAAA